MGNHSTCHRLKTSVKDRKDWKIGSSLCPLSSAWGQTEGPPHALTTSYILIAWVFKTESIWVAWISFELTI